MRTRRKGKRNLKFFGLFVVVMVVALALAIAYVVHMERPRRVSEEASVYERGKAPPRREIVRRQPGEKKTTGDLHQEPQKIAIIIDDIGYSLAPVNELRNLDASITFAILPHCAHSIDAAVILHRAGREVLLHLPMEPHDYPQQKPGIGALFVGMNDEEIKHQMEDDINSVPYARGINNHMGSRFMEDDAKIAVVLKQLKKRGLFFVDSRTTQSSKAEEIASRLGLAFISRNVFIDNEHTYQEAFQNLMNAGERNGPLLMIGHPYPGTIRALREALPILKARGVEIVSVSELVDRHPGSR